MNMDEMEQQKKPLILVVEDIPRNLQVVCGILEKEGYNIAAVSDGRQAIEMIPEVKPDLILLDVMMPEMNGFEVCRHLKADAGTREIPIIFLTAKADSEDILKGFEIGAVDYVTKPFNGAELLSRVKTHLELRFSREALREMNATKDRFFSILAHDLRDPMQYLLLSSDALSNQYDALDDDKRRNYFQRFYKTSRQISDLLENLLLWSRSQREMVNINRERLDIAALASVSAGLAALKAEKKEISLETRIEPGVTAFVDGNMIAVVLRNLLSNAVKFTHHGGSVILSAESDGDDVEITVADTGVGIKPEDRENLFRVDRQKTTQGTDKEKGTGLGLLICKELVEKNNGTISVDSEPGNGTRFTVTLPAAED